MRLLRLTEEKKEVDDLPIERSKWVRLHNTFSMREYLGSKLSLRRLKTVENQIANPHFLVVIKIN